ncbi:MAG: hypothetical protein HQ582_27895 [Planctomycetes bacterium]|nr:hypothetical protein [Planctomycetota bacterium]
MRHRTRPLVLGMVIVLMGIWVQATIPLQGGESERRRPAGDPFTNWDKDQDGFRDATEDSPAELFEMAARFFDKHLKGGTAHRN